MTKLARHITLAMILLAGLAGLLTATAVAQTAGGTAVDSTEPIPAPPTSEIDSPETDSPTDSNRCPRCGRQRGWRQGKAGDSRADDSTGPSGCRCGRNGGRRHKGQGPGYGSAANHPTGQRGRGHGRHGGGRQAEMSTYRALLENHTAIERTFEEIPGGIRSTTTTTDPEMLPILRRHVDQMIELLENDGWIRRWDPLFSEIFERSEHIETTVEQIDGGVVVTETSENDEVVALIRAHAAKVQEFVARGQEAYSESTPLPEGYENSER